MAQTDLQIHSSLTAGGELRRVHWPNAAVRDG